MDFGHKTLRFVALACAFTHAVVACAPVGAVEPNADDEEPTDAVLDEEALVMTKAPRTIPLRAFTRVTAKLALDQTPVAVALGAKTASARMEWAGLGGISKITTSIWNAQNQEVARGVYLIDIQNKRWGFDAPKSFVKNLTGAPVTLHRQQLVNLFDQAWTKLRIAVFNNHLQPLEADEIVATTTSALSTGTSTAAVYADTPKGWTAYVHTPSSVPFDPPAAGNNGVCEPSPLSDACWASMLTLGTLLVLGFAVGGPALVVTIAVNMTKSMGGSLMYALTAGVCTPYFARAWQERGDCWAPNYARRVTFRCAGQAFQQLDKPTFTAWVLPKPGQTFPQFDIAPGYVPLRPVNNQTEKTAMYNRCNTIIRIKNTLPFIGERKNVFQTTAMGGLVDTPCSEFTYAACQIVDVKKAPY
jgi:hypothetical protein